MKEKLKHFITTILVVTLLLAYLPVITLAKEAITLKESVAKTENVLKAEYKDGQAIIMYKKSNKTKVFAKTKSMANTKVESSLEFNKAKVKTPASAFSSKDGKEKTEDLVVSLVTSNNYSTEKLINELKKDRNIEYVEPNYKVKALNMTNDAYEEYQWAIENQGQNNGTEGYDINPITTENTDKEKIVVVVDTGVDYDHPDLKNVLWNNPFQEKELAGKHGYNFAYDNDDPLDDNGHGTHCAGIIAASSNNNYGITGTVMGNGSVKIMSLKFLDADGGGDNYGAISAYHYIYKAQKLYEESEDENAEIVCINNSWGGAIEDTDKILEEIINLVGDNGAISVCAAGNESMNTDEFKNSPSCLDSEYIISVAAANEKGELASFSNYGENTVDVAAPGTDILSTVSYESFNPTIYSAEEKTNLVDLDHFYDFSDGNMPFGTVSTIGEVTITNEKNFGKKNENNYSLSWKGNILESQVGKYHYMAFPCNLSETGHKVSMMVNARKEGTLEMPYVITQYDVDYDKIDFENMTENDFDGIALNGMLGYSVSSIGNKGDYWNHLEEVYYFDHQIGGSFIVGICPEEAGAFEINIDDIGYTKKEVSKIHTEKYDFYNGTSMATPYVTAAVAVASCKYQDDDTFSRKARILGSVRKSDDLKGKMAYPGIIDLSKIDNPAPAISRVLMNEDGSVFIYGKNFGTNPELYVDGIKLNSNYNEQEELISFDGNDYKNKYIQIKIKSNENEIVKNVFLSMGLPYETELYQSEEELYTMTTDGKDIYIYTNYNDFIRITPNDTCKNQDNNTAFGDDDDEWGEDDELDDNSLNSEVLEEVTISKVFGLYSIFDEEMDDPLLSSDLVYLNGKFYGIFTLNLGYTTEKVIASYSIEKNVWQKEIDLKRKLLNDGQTLAVYNGELYLIGGYDEETNACDTDVYTYNVKSHELIKKESLPEGRSFSKAIQYKDKLVVLLGKSNEDEVPEALIYDGNSWTKSNINPNVINNYENVTIAGIDKGIIVVGCIIDGMGDTTLYDVDNDTFVDTESSLGTTNNVIGTVVGDKFYAMSSDDLTLKSIFVKSRFKTLELEKSSEGVNLYVGDHDKVVEDSLVFLPGTITTLLAEPEDEDYFIKSFTVNGVKVNKNENNEYIYEGVLTDDTEVVLKAGRNVGATKINESKTKQTKDSITVYLNKAKNASGYRVYVYNTEKKKFEAKGDTETTSIKIKGLKPATTYRIKARAFYDIDGEKSYGAYSSEMKATTAPATPKIKVTAGSKKATIKWGKITGASGYDVRMATSKSGTYKTIKTIAKGSTVSYTKTGLTKGKTYYFKVRAYKTVNGKKIYGAYSTVVSAKIK